MTSSSGNQSAMDDRIHSSNKLSPDSQIVLVAITLIIIIVISVTVVGCTRYRRQKKRQEIERIENLHMEPLRDVQPLSERAGHIRHFTHPLAPEDEYAIAEKHNPPDQPHAYENAPIAEIDKQDHRRQREKRKSTLEVLIHRIKSKRGQRLTHTYMENVLPENESCVQQKPAGDVSSSSDCKKVDEGMGANANTKDEYETITEDGMSTSLTYDHLDRPAKGDASKSQSNRNTSPNGKVSNEYGILIHSSSLDAQEDYDIFQRSSSQSDKPETEGYGSLGRDSETLSEPRQSVGANPVKVEVEAVYNSMDRGVSFTSSTKGKPLLGKLYRSKEGAVYGHLLSSTESPDDEQCLSPDRHPETEPIYQNQDSLSNAFEAEDQRTSAYTDMNRGSINEPGGNGLDFAYTEMSLGPVENSEYYNMIMHESEEPAPGNDKNYSSIADCKEEEYDHVERRMGGGTTSLIDDETPQPNSHLLYENM